MDGVESVALVDPEALDDRLVDGDVAEQALVDGVDLSESRLPGVDLSGADGAAELPDPADPSETGSRRRGLSVLSVIAAIGTVAALQRTTAFRATNDPHAQETKRKADASLKKANQDGLPGTAEGHRRIFRGRGRKDGPTRKKKEKEKKGLFDW